MTHERNEKRYVYMPGRGSVLVEGFPAAILSYRAEEVSHIVPGRYERDLVDWARELAPKSKQFVDCGAHMGSWSIVMASHFHEVHAFEPQRLLFQQLCGNAALNGLDNVFVYNMGLDAEPGRLTLHRPGVDRGSSSARTDVVEHFFTASGISTSPEIISVARLDSFVEVLNNVGLIKIDVEGLELRVLRGAVEILRRNNLPKMLIECWSHAWYRKDKEAVLSFLDELGYHVELINRYDDILLAVAQ
jgi:FkbM family methyltransferase